MSEVKMVIDDLKYFSPIIPGSKNFFRSSLRFVLTFSIFYRLITDRKEEERPFRDPQTQSLPHQILQQMEMDKDSL